MISSTDPDYLDTKLVKQGAKRMDPLFQELAGWIDQQFDTTVLNIYYDKIKFDKNRPRLSVIFEYYGDSRKFLDSLGNFDSNKQQAIAEKFNELLSVKHTSGKGLVARLLAKLTVSKFDTKRLLVIFDEFEPVARHEANFSIPKAAIERFKQEWASKHVWEIYREFETTIFFFHTDKQMEEAKADGTTQVMTQQYFDMLKKYDVFDYFNADSYSLAFDSKENFDANYESNWFYYSRR